MAKSIKDQLQDLANTRAAKQKRMEAIIQKTADEARSMDDAEKEEFDNLEAEIKSLDDDIGRLSRMESIQKKAVPVQAAADPNQQREAATQQRGRTDVAAPAIVLQRQPDDKFKGQSFCRIQIAKMLGQIHNKHPLIIARERGWNKTHPVLVEVLKASVAGAGSDSGEWGAELVSADNRYTGDFIEFLYAATVFDRLPFREVPANITIKGQDGAATGYWVGQSKGIPASAQDYSAVSLVPLKVAALCVTSIELMEDSTPAAEALFRDGLVQASAQRIDQTLFSTAAASSGVSPAGLLNGVSPIAATGLDGDSVIDGVRSLYAPFISAKNASDLRYVMNPGRAKAIGLIRNAFGQDEFPGLGTTGGTLKGDPVVTGDNINEAHVILLKASDIYKIGDGGVGVFMSRDATIEQADNPAGATDTPVAQANYPTNMFQEHSVAIKVVRRINFAKRRSHAVQYVSDASWGDSSS